MYDTKRLFHTIKSGLTEEGAQWGEKGQVKSKIVSWKKSLMKIKLNYDDKGFADVW